MDIATVVGIIFALVSLGIGIQEHITSMLHLQSAAIVLGGTIAAALIANPLPDVINFAGVYKNSILNKPTVPTELVEKIVGFAETARREGILALEQAVEDTDDAFLGAGIRLAVDGTEPDLIMDVLETELQFVGA